MKGIAQVCGCFPTGLHYPGIAHLMRSPIMGVAQDIEASASWRDLPVAMLDTETTGRDPNEDRIVEIGIVIGRGGEVVQRHAWLLNPGRPIPAEATAVHGISDKDVRNKPSFADVCDEVLKALQDAIPAAYNATFDRGFLLAEVRRCGGQVDAPAVRDRVVWLDPLVWARHLYASAKSRRLGEVAEMLGVQLENAHRATDDAEAALRVMYKMGEDERIPTEYGTLIQEQMRIARAQEEARRIWRNR